MANENLYINIKNRICEMIFNGEFQEGDKLPPERVLAQDWDISRVTVRKALELLEKEKLILREIGSGTRITFQNHASQGKMDILVLLAPSKNPFFAQFIARFQTYAARKDTLVLFVEKFSEETLEECLFRLYKKGLHNAVIWPDEVPVQEEQLKRLRAMGMNMVFFDTDEAYPYGDCVYLDNENGMRTLCQELRQAGAEEVEYLTWDKEEMFSIKVRQESFRNVMGDEGKITRIPWKERYSSGKCVKQLLAKKKEEGSLPRGILCCDDHMGIQAAAAVRSLKLTGIPVASVDEFPGAAREKITTCGQDFDKTAGQVFSCLESQNALGEDWKAQRYQIPGILTRRIEAK